MSLERFELSFYAALARNELLKRRGSSFQDFFIEVGHHRWAPDFEGRRTQGRVGDKKCDGYKPSDQTVFQCYAPRDTCSGLIETAQCPSIELRRLTGRSRSWKNF